MRHWLLPAALLLSPPGCGLRPKGAAPPASQLTPPVRFVDATEEAGVRFVHENGARGRKYLPETMGSGCAFLDFDNDGILDLFLANGASWPGDSPPVRSTPRLYRGTPGGRFQDATHPAGLAVTFYGMGAAVGDYDGDGWDDLYLTGVGRGRLLRNVAGGDRRSGGRRFVDVTASAGVASPGWSTSATWLDYDRDGRLDLFVCHYVQWSPGTNRFFSLDGTRPSYSTPEQYPGEPCRLYRNLGRGRFEDVSRAAGILHGRSKALGVVAYDFDQDGWIDIAVTNDTEPNFLFHNQGDGRFKEVALEMGIAVSEEGKAKAGMGIDIGDEQASGRESILITNFSGEQVTLYRMDRTGHYLDVAAQSGIGSASQFYLGFGAFFFDYDLDGWLDIFVANGHIQGDVELRETGVVYREPALLLRNQAGRRFADVTASAGAALTVPRIGRGAAWGDYDNDGDSDILITSNRGDPDAGRRPDDGRACLLRNEGGNRANWLRLRLEGVASNRNAYGARVRVRAGGLAVTHTVRCASSYLSQCDRRPLFGLGAARRVEGIEIQWPAGQVQTLGGVEANQSLLIREGEAPRPDR